MQGLGMLTGRNMVRSLAGVLGTMAGFAILYLPLTRVTIYLILAALAAGGVVLYASERKHSRVRAEARAFAGLNGWTFQENLDGFFAGLKTPPFDATEMTYTQVVTGRFGGCECYDGLFEWCKRIDKDNYISGSHRVAAVRLPDELPRLLLVPEGLGARLAKAFGGADIDFESSTFNRSWRVLADNPKVAYEMLSPRVLARLDEMESKSPLLFERGLGVRIDDDSKGIDSLAERLGGILAVVRFLPEHTIEDYGRLANSIGPLPSTATPGALTHGYNAAMQQADEEHQRTAKPLKQQRWIDTARTGEPPAVLPPNGP
jgi:hypothetical protein